MPPKNRTTTTTRQKKIASAANPSASDQEEGQLVAKRGRTKGKKASSAQSQAPPSPDVSPVHSDADNQPDELSTEHHMSNAEAIPPSGTESASALQKKKKQQRKHTDLSDDDKEAIKEWLKANPIIYNKRLTEFRDTEKKLGLWAELADQLGHTVDELTTFYDTARSNMSRAKKMFRSGMSPDQFTVTLIWYWERFQFLLPHISDVKSRNVASFTATLGAAAATSRSTTVAVPTTDMSPPPDADALSDIGSDTPPVSVSASSSSVTPAATAVAKGGDRSVIGEYH